MSKFSGIIQTHGGAELTVTDLDLEQEEPKGTESVEPPAAWPSREGSVIVSNLTCKYAPQLDPVLRDLSFTIGPREKIGICGRTGSGKSTLALSFFRFLYQEGGSIAIDGLDISKLSLLTLRERLTILPQGTLNADEVVVIASLVVIVSCFFAMDKTLTYAQRLNCSPAQCETTWTHSGNTRTSRFGMPYGSVALPAVRLAPRLQHLAP